MSVCDKFHQGNSKNPTAVMRKTELVKELDGVVTETAEQFNNFISRDAYYLDIMSPIHHIQMTKLIVAERNNRKNEKIRKDMEGLLQHGSLVTDTYGRLVIQSSPPPTTTVTQSPPLPQSTSSPTPPSIASPSVRMNVSNGLLPCRSTWCSPNAGIIEYAQSTSDNAPFTLGYDDLITLEQGKYLAGQVIDALLLFLSAELFKDGIRTVIVPECFFTQIHQDSNMEMFVPDCVGIDFLVAASYFSHHWSLVLLDVAKKIIYYLLFRPKRKLCDIRKS